MSRAECEVQLAVTTFGFEVEQHVAEGFSTSCAFKDLNRLQRWHEEFNRAGFVHFLTDDL